MPRRRIKRRLIEDPELFRYIPRTPRQTAEQLFAMMDPISIRDNQSPLNDTNKEFILNADNTAVSGVGLKNRLVSKAADVLLTGRTRFFSDGNEYRIDLGCGDIWQCNRDDEKAVDADSHYDELDPFFASMYSSDDNKKINLNIDHVESGPHGVALQSRLVMKANDVLLNGGANFFFENVEYNIDASGDVQVKTLQ